MKLPQLFRFAVAALLLVVGGLPAQAQQAATPQALVVTASNRTAAADAARGAARNNDQARPGDVLHYTLTFRNVNDRAVTGVTLANPLPAGVRYVANSAQATRQDARAEYSADGGKTFSTQPMEEVVVDGRAVTRPIPAERFTHVRWIVTGTVAPGATVVAEFDARVNAGSPAPAVRGR